MTELMSLYSSKWGNLKKAMASICEDNRIKLKPANPLLISVDNEDEYVSADLRLMIFGQETNSWYNESETIESVLKGYDDFFNSGDCYSYGGHFWNGIKRFVAMISKKFPNIKTRYIWNNIVKIGKAEEKGMPPDYIYKIEREFFPVIKDELRILKPNFVLFLTGPNYDKIIEDTFGKLDFAPILPYSTRQIAKLKIGNISAIRTYHPRFLWMNGINSYFDAILREIKI